MSIDSMSMRQGLQGALRDLACPFHLFSVAVHTVSVSASAGPRALFPKAEQTLFALSSAVQCPVYSHTFSVGLGSFGVRVKNG